MTTIRLIYPMKHITTAIGCVLVVAWFAWELALTVFRTLILGQSAERQCRDISANTNDE
jgi:hypothetical protein